jgi:hypothetical protein
MTVARNKKILRTKTLKCLRKFFLLKFSQIISEGQGANSRDHSYTLIRRVTFTPSRLHLVGAAVPMSCFRS